MHAFVILKLIEIDPNKIGIYLTETEFYALLIILVANLIYDYAKDNSEILFSKEWSQISIRLYCYPTYI